MLSPAGAAGPAKNAAEPRAERLAWGDVLVAFGDGDAPSAHRAEASPWRSEAAGEGWRVWSQPPTAGWRGHPVRAVETAGGLRLWILGEPHGVAAPESLDPAGSAASWRTAMNGHLLAVGRAADGAWHVWTDRFGTLHAYVAASGSRAAIGTSFDAVAAVSRRRLDWEGLAGFFACGFFPSDLTYYDDVRVLRPGMHYVFDAAGRARSEERWALWTHAPDRRRSYRETLEEFTRLLHEVLDGSAAGAPRLAVPISGGLDSRTTVAALTRPGAPGEARLWSYSYGYGADSVETAIASRVAAARRLPFRAFEIRPYLLERRRDVLACIEGFADLTQSRQAIVSDLLARESDRVLAAHWGDVWLDDMGIPASTPEPEIAGKALEKIRKRGGAWLVENLAARRLGGPAETLLRERVAAELSRVSGIAEPDFRVKAFKTEQWSFRWTVANLRMFQAGSYPRLPFYDSRLADFFATVPTELVAGRRLQVDYLKREAPDLARITWQAFDTNLYLYPFFDTLLLPSRAWKKLRRSLRGAAPAARNWEIQLRSEAGRAGLESLLVSEGAPILELVPRESVRSLLDAFYAGPPDPALGYTVSMLMSFATWWEAHV
jgi:asparagine synthase (glutamine-hydrolysing)